MKAYYKVLIALGILTLLALSLNFGLNLWIDKQLPKIINRENDSKYFITYKNIDVSLWSSNIVAKGIVVVPKEALKDSINKSGIYANVEAIKVTDFKIWDMVFNDKIKARRITIEKPQIILYRKDKKATIKESVVGPFDKIISVSDIDLKNGDVKIIETKTNKAVLSVQNISVLLDGIVITESVLNDKIPFQFRDYTLSCDSLYYHPNEVYHLKAKKIKGTKSSLRISAFELLPSYSRKQFVASIAKEKDLNTIRCKSIAIGKMNWGFKNDDFFFHTQILKLDQVAANIYRSKVPADDLSKKPLYNKLLRELQFDLKVDTLKLRNSMVEYEEEKSFEFGAGKVSFHKFNAVVTNINSGFKKTTLPDVKIKVNCKFMNAAPLDVDWTFNVMDKSDGFSIKGVMTHLDAENMARFTKPYMNVSVTGVLDKVRFNFNGNDRTSSGVFAVEYDDLKLTVYQKDDREKKNKFLTFVAKVFVKKDTKERLKQADIDIERIPEKSFYNLLWRSVAEGLKKILI